MLYKKKKQIENCLNPVSRAVLESSVLRSSFFWNYLSNLQIQNKNTRAWLHAKIYFKVGKIAHFFLKFESFMRTNQLTDTLGKWSWCYRFAVMQCHPWPFSNKLFLFCCGWSCMIFYKIKLLKMLRFLQCKHVALLQWLRLRLRLIYLGRIAEKVKYITYLGCAPARREGSRTENWKIYEE